MKSNPVTTDTERVIESVRIRRVESRENVRALLPQGQSKLSVLSGLNLEKCKGFLSPGTKQTVSNNEVSVLRGLKLEKM